MSLKQKLLPLVVGAAMLCAPKLVEAQNYPITLNASIGTNTFIKSTFSENAFAPFSALKIGAGISLSKNHTTNFDMYFLSQKASVSMGNNSYADSNLGIFLFDLEGRTNLPPLDATSLYGIGGVTYLAGSWQVTTVSQGQIQTKDSSNFFGWGSFLGGGLDIAFNPSLSVCIESRVRRLMIGDTPNIWCASLEAGINYKL